MSTTALESTRFPSVLALAALAAACIAGCGGSAPSRLAAASPPAVTEPSPPPDVAPAPAPAVDRAAVKRALAERRALQVERLRAYARLGVFPRNRVQPDVINVFRDEDGLLCAVANLIWLDGEVVLVEHTATHDNYVKMGELTGGPLYDWILASGFTREEIAAIQLPDSPVNRKPGWAIAENERIRLHLAAVDAQLAQSTDASLELATDRLIASGGAAALLARVSAPAATPSA